MFFAKNATSFTFNMCDSKLCSEIFDEINFTLDFINNYYKQNSKNIIRVALTNGSDITFNLDGINHNIIFRINKTEYTPNIIIQTNRTEISYIVNIPRIYTSDFNVIIDNINEESDKTLFVFEEILFKSLSPKNPQKPLVLIGKNLDSLYFDAINQETIYLSGERIYIYTPSVHKSKIFFFFPVVIYSNRYASESCRVKLRHENNTRTTYRKNNIITVEKENGVILTFRTDSKRVEIEQDFGDNSTVTIEENLDQDDIIFPNFYTKNDNDNLPAIKGNWPFMKPSSIKEKYLSNGTILYGFSRDIYITGQYSIQTNFIQISNVHVSTYILNEKNTSIYYDRGFIGHNLTLKTKDDTNGICHIYGRPLFFTSQFENFIIIDSPGLTVYVRAMNKVRKVGPGTMIYEEIDNSNLEFNSTLNFKKGGTIINPFGFDYNETYKEIKNVFDEYNKTQTDTNLTNISDKANFYINFIKNKILDLTQIVNEKENKILNPIKINLTESDSKSEMKSTLFLMRKDIPLSALYTNALGKISDAVCVEEGTIDPSMWNIKIGKNLLHSFLVPIENGFDYYEEPEKNLKYLPSFSNTDFKSDLVLSEDEKCIGIQLKSIPKSSFEIIVYTSNSTFIEIFEKIEIISLLTPDDLDAYSNLKSKDSKNIILLILNDLPEGKSINLNKIQRNSNVFLIGFKTEYIEDIYEVINDISLLDHNEKNETYYQQLSEYLTKISSQYKKYLPKASVTFSSVQTFCIISVEYYGAQIRCTNFYSFFSTFSNIKSLSRSFNAQTLITDSLTYKLMSELNFVDVVLVFVSDDPFNLLNVDQIDFKENDWTFTLSSYYNKSGFELNKAMTYLIETSKIKGNLFIYSFKAECVFNAPENKKNQILKGLVLKSGFLSNFKIKDIPGIAILEDKEEEDKNIKNILSQFFIEEQNDGKITFEGFWDQVSSIEGIIEINTGDQPAIVENIPSIVASNLDVKSDKNIELTTQSEKIELSQIVSGSKTINFTNSNIDVTFSNLTFEGELPSLTLLINGVNSKVITDNLIIEEDSSAMVSSDIVIKNSIEIGPESSIAANSLSATNPEIIMKYRLNKNFGTIDDGIDPSSLICLYIGESGNADSIPDYAMYLGSVNVIKKFTASDHVNKCEEWKKKTKIESKSYPQFQGENAIIGVVCIHNEESSRLAINVTSIPEVEPDNPEQFLSSSDEIMSSIEQIVSSSDEFLYPTPEIADSTRQTEESSSENNAEIVNPSQQTEESSENNAEIADSTRQTEESSSENNAEIVNPSQQTEESSENNAEIADSTRQTEESSSENNTEIVNPSQQTESSSENNAEIVNPSQQTESSSENNVEIGDDSSKDGKKFPIAAIIGIVVGVIVIICIVSVLVWYFVYYRPKHKENSINEDKEVDENNNEISNDDYYEAGIVEYV